MRYWQEEMLSMIFPKQNGKIIKTKKGKSQLVIDVTI